jgi:hypothetical protein
MEHGNNPAGGEDAERSELVHQVDAAIETARLHQRSIDDLTAKRIATDIQPGRALYDLSATGKISDDIYAELDVAREVLPDIANTWLAALEDYCLGHAERGQLAGWADLENAAVTDEQRIYHGITEALLEQRPIDHGTARAIAAQLHSGQVSALCALASTGALIYGLQNELDAWRQSDDTPVEVEPWLEALDEYIDSRADNLGPVDGWHQLWPPQPKPECDESATGDDGQPPSGATHGLGQLASGAVVEQPRDERGDIPRLETFADCDGFGWMERLPAGWQPIPSWGRDGWDLAHWPYSIVVMYDNPDAETYAFGIYTEGDIAVMRQPTHLELYAAIDDLAEWYWRNGVALGPEDMPKGSGLLAHHRGPFSEQRLRRWERERGRQDHSP